MAADDKTEDGRTGSAGRTKTTTPARKDDGAHVLRPKGGPRAMPGDFSISLAAKGGTDRLLVNPGNERLQSMRGFEETYVDIVDYIVRVTHRIWEEKHIGYIYETYRHNSRVMDDYGMQHGRGKIVADTVHTINAFPDIRLLAEEIIWAGDDEVGFHTSHRVVHLARNTGHSKYGPPTGRKVPTRTIANCFVKENMISEEWVVRDGLALVRQLGLDENEVVDRMLEADERKGVKPSHGPPERVAGQTLPPPNPEKTAAGFDPGFFVRRSLNELWNWRLFDRIAQDYAPNYLCHTSSNRTIYGTGGFKAYVLAFIAAFPDARLSVDDLYWIGDEREGYRVATRWTLIGTHEGPSVYGVPTGKPVEVMGVSHHLVRDERFVEEWTVFDELALLKQLRG